MVDSGDWALLVPTGNHARDLSWSVQPLRLCGVIISASAVGIDVLPLAPEAGSISKMP